MATRVPLLIIDEIMLPVATTEVGLDLRESRHLTAALPDGVGPVAIGAREPGRPAPTALEQHATGPGELVPAALLGEGCLLEPDERDPVPRLALEGPTRVRVLAVHPDGEGWQAEVEPWPVDRAGLDAEAIAPLRRRFYRALLASLDPEELGDGADALERPVDELETTDDPLRALLLIADYLYERPDVRRAMLVADDASSIVGAVEDALELLETGRLGGERAIHAALGEWIRALGSDRLPALGRAAKVLSALVGVVDGGERVAEEARAVVADLASLQRRLDKLLDQALGQALGVSGRRRRRR